MKNILTVNGFDNVQSLCEIDENDIIEMECFGESHCKNIIPAMAQIGDYIHFMTKLEDFIILPGHKKWLCSLKKYIIEALRALCPCYG